MGVNLLMDWTGKRKNLLWLWAIHILTTLNVLGGYSSSLFQIYSVPTVTSKGLLLAAALGPAGNYDCPSATGDQIAWCDNFWITIQLCIAFIYVVLEVFILLLISSRMLTHYGGSRADSDDAAGAQGLIEA